LSKVLPGGLEGDLDLIGIKVRAFDLSQLLRPEPPLLHHELKLLEDEEVA